MRAQARFAFAFCAAESCGKCTPCRIGSTRGVELIDRLGAARAPDAVEALPQMRNAAKAPRDPVADDNPARRPVRDDEVRIAVRARRVHALSGAQVRSGTGRRSSGHEGGRSGDPGSAFRLYRHRHSGRARRAGRGAGGDRDQRLGLCGDDGNPVDLEDFVTGFVLAEGLATTDELGPIQLHPVAGGARHSCADQPSGRAARPGDGARAATHWRQFLGICGIDSVEAALRPLPPLTRRHSVIRPQAGSSARSPRCADAQVLGRATAATTLPPSPMQTACWLCCARTSAGTMRSTRFLVRSPAQAPIPRRDSFW